MDILATARAALDTGPLCDACLGRLVADRSHGLGNGQRGSALRIACLLDDDEPYEVPTDCWVCEGECERIDEWASRAATAVRGYDFSTYQVGTQVPPLLAENDDLLREDVGLDADAGEPLKREFNREIGKRVGSETGAEVDFERPHVQFLVDLASDELSVTVNSAFVYGRYRKLERHIPQTEWPCRKCMETGIYRGEECPGCDGTGYRYDDSVEELVAPHVQAAMDGTEATFHGAGREDVDALMLGTGRPFVVEVDEPRHRRPDVEDLAATINDANEGRVEVDSLALATHDSVERVKECDASKTYRAEVRFGESGDGADGDEADGDGEAIDGQPIEGEDVPALDQAALDEATTALAGATIEQETPQRVSHRRSDLTRTREVYAADADYHGDGTATVEIHGEGGLYVKELVSSDEGRTEPSLAGLLGVPATVTELDVLAVEAEDEPFLPDEMRLEEA